MFGQVSTRNLNRIWEMLHPSKFKVRYLARSFHLSLICYFLNILFMLTFPANTASLGNMWITSVGKRKAKEPCCQEHQMTEEIRGWNTFPLNFTLLQIHHPSLLVISQFLTLIKERPISTSEFSEAELGEALSHSKPGGEWTLVT